MRAAGQPVLGPETTSGIPDCRWAPAAETPRPQRPVWSLALYPLQAQSHRLWAEAKETGDALSARQCLALREALQGNCFSQWTQASMN